MENQRPNSASAPTSSNQHRLDAMPVEALDIITSYLNFESVQALIRASNCWLRVKRLKQGGIQSVSFESH